jgi:hypothetical protein
MVLADLVDTILQLPQRKLVVAQRDVHLNNKQMNNEIFVLMVEESKGSAGGRAGGSGHRRIEKIYGFSCDVGECTKFFEANDPEMVDQFDIPYSAVAMDITLSDGKSYVVQGIIDPDFVASYHSVMSNLK